jgi:hypothetical protein
MSRVFGDNIYQLQNALMGQISYVLMRSFQERIAEQV